MGSTYSMGVLDKGMTHARPGQSRKPRVHHTTQNSAQFKIFELWIAEIFHFICLNRGWWQVAETLESKATDKGFISSISECSVGPPCLPSAGSSSCLNTRMQLSLSVEYLLSCYSERNPWRNKDPVRLTSQISPKSLGASCCASGTPPSPDASSCPEIKKQVS